MFLIDISVPRNIDPAVRPIDDAFLFDIDDLYMRVEQNREDRLREAAKAEQMVVGRGRRARQWLQSLEVTPTIVALRSRTEDIKRREVDKVLARMPHLSSDDRAAVEALASAIVNKMVHGTMVTLKNEATSSSGAAYVDAARRFFSLEETQPVYPPSRQRRRNSLREMVPFTTGGFSESSLVQHTTKEPGRRGR